MIAKRFIRKGERILTETPLLRWSWSEEFDEFWKSGGKVPQKLEAQLQDMVRDLPSQEQELFWSLSDHYASDSACGICLTNGLPVGEDTQEGALCPLGSRFNHSCVPNVNHSWHDSWRASSRCEYTWHAVRDIEPGEELTIFYITDLMMSSTEIRKKDLQYRYLFDCRCAACAREGEARRASDERRLQIAKFDSEVQKALRRARISTGKLRRLQRLRSKSSGGQLPEALRMVGELAALVDEELDGNAWAKAHVLYNGFELARACDRQQELAKSFLQRAHDEALCAEGPGGKLTSAIRRHLRRLASADSRTVSWACGRGAAPDAPASTRGGRRGPGRNRGPRRVACAAMPEGARSSRRPAPAGKKAAGGTGEEAKKGARLLIDLKFSNELPKPPVPKLLKALPSAERLFQYQPTSLELDHRPFLLSEEEMLARLELVDPDAYGEVPARGSMPPPPAPVDAQLLRDDDVSDKVKEAEVKRRRLTERTEADHRQAFGLQLPLLITNDVFTERQRYTTGTEAAEKKLERHPPGFASVQELSEKIESSFQFAKEPPVHPTKKDLRPKRIMPVVPDAVLWVNRYRQVIFDEVPVEPSLNDLLFKTTPTPRSTCFGFFSPVDGAELGSYSLMQNYLWDNRGDFTRRSAVGEGETVLLSFPKEDPAQDADPSKSRDPSAAGEVRFVAVPTMMRLKKQKAARLELNLDLQALSVKHREQTAEELDEDQKRSRQVLFDEHTEADKSEASLDYIDGQWVIQHDPRSQGRSTSRHTGAESSALDSQPDLFRSEAAS